MPLVDGVCALIRKGALKLSCMLTWMWCRSVASVARCCETVAPMPLERASGGETKTVRRLAAVPGSVERVRTTAAKLRSPRRAHPSHSHSYLEILTALPVLQGWVTEERQF